MRTSSGLTYGSTLYADRRSRQPLFSPRRASAGYDHPPAASDALDMPVAVASAKTPAQSVHPG